MIATMNTNKQPAKLKLASRASPLALAQTTEVCALLKDIETEIVKLSTTGDEVLDRPLVQVGGKVFLLKH